MDALRAAERAVRTACGLEVPSVTRSYWGAHQNFFKQLLNSIKCRFAISEAQAALDRGECVVVGLLCLLGRCRSGGGGCRRRRGGGARVVRV